MITESSGYHFISGHEIIFMVYNSGMKRKLLLIAIIAFVLVPLSASDDLYSLNFNYSIHKGNHLGGEISFSSTAGIHTYGGYYALIGLEDASPALATGLYLGIGFTVPLTSNESLLLQFGTGADIPLCIDSNTIAVGLGVTGDAGLRWRFNDFLFISGGIKASYYFSYFGIRESKFGFVSGDGLMHYRITPYVGLGASF